jgi:glyoxylase-like metal-dependent hydrolase (beta-lactamase superfamily II)
MARPSRNVACAAQLNGLLTVVSYTRINRRKARAVTPIPFTPDLSQRPEVEGFFDEGTNTISYIVRDPGSAACAVIDPVMDIDYAAGRITHDHADALIARIEERGLRLDWLIETHVHADHLSAAPYIQDRLGGRIGIGAWDHGRAGGFRQDLQRRDRVPARRLAI